MQNRLITLSLAMLGATVFVSSARAQRHVAFASPPAGRTGMGVLRGVHPRRAHHRVFGGSGYAPYFDSQDDSEPEIIEAPPPQIIVQTVQPAAPAPVPNPPESLVLESQGDHWVRITNHGQSQIGQSDQPEPERASNPPSAIPSAIPSARPRRTSAAEPPGELPAAVLVFRDGHEEEIGKYTIVGATLYTSADYWSTGSWTRRVPIAELDIPATLKRNQERGARFRLPSGPNEVMVRP